MEKETDWFKQTVFYEIYVPSFCDGNGDGVGDLPGVISRLPYLSRLGISGIWLTPFYPSPKADNGYDVSDYRNVDPLYGSLEDFDLLLETAHREGIRVIIDMVLNHTSVAHPWFQESRSRADSPFRDYYIWEKEAPNNWQSFFDGSAWEYDAAAGMYYYHAFAKEQACLNWGCGRVRQECLDVLRFWLDRGVDGFRLDVINFLKTDRTAFGKNNPEKDGEIQHIYDKNQKGIQEALGLISDFVHAWPEKYLLGEVGEEDLQLINTYVGKGRLDSAFQFNLGSMPKMDPAYMAEQIRRMEEEDIYPTLFFSSHDMKRHFERLCGRDLSQAKLLALFLLTAKGIPFLYQGEEIPMKDVVPRKPEDLKDVQGVYGYLKKRREGLSEKEAFAYAAERARDYSRGPVEWPEPGEETVLQQIYRQLLDIRNKYPALLWGGYGGIEQEGEKLCYRRTWQQEKLGVYLNFGGEEMTVPKGDILFCVEDENGRTTGILQLEGTKMR